MSSPSHTTVSAPVATTISRSSLALPEPMKVAESGVEPALHQAFEHLRAGGLGQARPARPCERSADLECAVGPDPDQDHPLEPELAVLDLGDVLELGRDAGDPAQRLALLELEARPGRRGGVTSKGSAVMSCVMVASFNPLATRLMPGPPRPRRPAPPARSAAPTSSSRHCTCSRPPGTSTVRVRAPSRVHRGDRRRAGAGAARAGLARRRARAPASGRVRSPTRSTNSTLTPSAYAVPGRPAAVARGRARRSAPASSTTRCGLPIDQPAAASVAPPMVTLRVGEPRRAVPSRR